MANFYTYVKEDLQLLKITCQCQMPVPEINCQSMCQTQKQTVQELDEIRGSIILPKVTVCMSIFLDMSASLNLVPKKFKGQRTEKGQDHFSHSDHKILI